MVGQSLNLKLFMILISVPIKLNVPSSNMQSDFLELAGYSRWVFQVTSGGDLKICAYKHNGADHESI